MACERNGRAALWGASLFALVAGGCGADVPEEPTWAEDVRPILLANCARCHSFPPTEGAPNPANGDGLRLDVYGDTTLDEGTEFGGEDVGGEVVPGAGAVADRIVARAVESETMPPSFPLLPRQQEILERWYENGAERGPPAPGNRPPEIELRRPLEESREGDVVALRYEIRDPDFDYVTGSLRALPSSDSSDPIVITRALHSGRDEVRWEVGELAGESYELAATLDDGSDVFEDIVIGAIDLE